MKQERVEKTEVLYTSAWNSIVLNNHIEYVEWSAITQKICDLIAKRTIESGVDPQRIIDSFRLALMDDSDKSFMEYFEKLPTNKEKLSFVLHTKLLVVRKLMNSGAKLEFCNSVLVEIKSLFQRLPQSDVIDIAEVCSRRQVYAA